jgi:alpha/beta superfamily hydrolase
MVNNTSNRLIAGNLEYPEIIKTTSNPINLDIQKILLSTPSQSSSQKCWSIVKLSLKILFAPITIIAYLIHALFSEIASSNGLGNEQALKNINSMKRDELLHLGGQEIRFGFNEKALLEGMVFKTNSPTANAKTILICTGSHRSYEDYAIPMVNTFLSMGHNVMTFNYEGFGKSDGKASEDGVYRSVEAAYQYLIQEKGCKDQDIIGWGYSLGSGAVTNLAINHKINIVVDRGFSTMSEVAYQCAPSGLKTLARFIFFVGAHFDNVSKLNKVKGNILVAQGKNDTTMNGELHGKLLHEAVSNNPNGIFRNVDSAHIHTADDVWFAKGEDRTFVEQFLKA